MTAFRLNCVLLVVVILIGSQSVGLAETPTEQAMALFKTANYPGAIAVLEEALAQTPDDAEIHYYLGYFTHYLCYDSMPLTGFDRSKSDEVLRHLSRAIALDPDHGNAYYFLGAEYGARAVSGMKRQDRNEVAEQFRLGRLAGGFPDWLLESGRNLLRSCAKDALLFVGGDADANPVFYLQYVETFRTDVTVMPIGLLDRPWFITLLKTGGDGLVTPAPISWDEAQISAMRPYKWQQNTISCRLSDEVADRYGAADPVVSWTLTPDLKRGDGRELLGAGRAVLSDILMTNRWQRSVYMSPGCSPDSFDGLQDRLQISGFAQRLLPVAPESGIDIAATRDLILDPTAFASVPTYSDRNMPRAAAMLHNYRSIFLRLTNHYLQAGDREEATEVFKAMDRLVPRDVLPVAGNLESTVEAFAAALYLHTEHIADNLDVKQVASGVFLVTHAFPWPANSLIVEMANSELVLVDTPYTPAATKELLDWIEVQFGERSITAINTGYHYDNLGGNSCLIEQGIPVYGSHLTARLLAERGDGLRTQTLTWLKDPKNERFLEIHRDLPYVPPTRLFDIDAGLDLEFANQSIRVHYPGLSHAPDNVVVHFPDHRVLFGGCMVIGWNGVGNTTEADLAAWTRSVQDLRRFDVDLIVPGHGKRLDVDLLDHTIRLLDKEVTQ
jgi:metallo-beta-lactamase class B